MPIVPIAQQSFNVVKAGAITTGLKGKNPQTKMAPTKGSKTQKRKANKK